MDGLRREDRICGQKCGLRKGGDVEHFVLRCGRLLREKEVLMKRMAEVTAGFEEHSDKEKVVQVLKEGCTNVHEARESDRVHAEE